MTGVSLVKLPSDECHWIFQTINQYWFRWWLGAVKQQVSAWANVDPDLCRHTASLGYNDLTHSGSAHENTYHVCDKQALTNKDAYVYEMWAFIRYLLFSYCPLLRQNIDLGGGGGRCFMIMTCSIFDARHQWWDARVVYFLSIEGLNCKPILVFSQMLLILSIQLIKAWN